MSTPETTTTPERASPGLELKEMLAALEHNKPPPIMTPCVEPGTLGTAVSVQSNAYGIVVDKENEVFVYDIRIYSEITATKTVEFTKKGKDDCLVNERKEKATTVLDALILQKPEQFPDKFKIYYDGQSLLFTLYDLFVETEERSRLFPMDPATLPGDLTTLPNIFVNIKTADRKSFVISPDAIASKTANSDLRDNERLISQFLEIAFNEYAVRTPERHKCYEQGKTYMCHPENEGFSPRDCPQVGDGKQLKAGSQKSIRQCEGPLGRGTNNSSLIIDSKKAPFHMPINCAEKIREICGPNVNYEADLSIRHLDKLKHVFKGLYIATTHLKRNKKLRVSNIAQTTSLNTRFTLPSGDVTVAEYFSIKYGIVLKHPHLPLLVVEERGQTNAYPAEVCQVVPYQRVTVSQTTSQQSQQTTKACVVPPLTRQSNIVKGARALEVFGEENHYIKNAGLQLCRQPMMVRGRQLPAMAISVVGNDNIPVVQGQWKMSRGGYLVPATCKVWAAYMVEDANRYSHDELFVKRFTEECRHKGMHMPNPTEAKTLSSRDIQERLKVAKENQCEFAFLVVADEMDDLHSRMKFWEREMVLVTQHVKTMTMINVLKKNRRATLENIINKTNCKLGGLNYGINVLHINGIASKWFTDQRLVIGISVSMPPPTATFKPEKKDIPLVVGYAANMKSNVFEYVGDFMFQDTNHTKVLGSLKFVIEETVRRHKENHGGVAADEIVIYRSGVDEGHYGAIISNDVPLIRAQLEQMRVKAKVAFIVVQKQHNVRLMRTQIDPQATIANQNVPPGVVTDQELTHPAYKEFFLNSHVTLQGSAKTPRYTVLVDDMDMKMDDIEGMTYALAHDHQIIQGTVSLPAPLYIAQRYAERGRMIFNTYDLQQESSSGSSSGQWDDVNKKLSYKGTNLASARVNA